MGRFDDEGITGALMERHWQSWQEIRITAESFSKLCGIFGIGYAKLVT